MNSEKTADASNSFTIAVFDQSTLGSPRSTLGVGIVYDAAPKRRVAEPAQDCWSSCLLLRC